MPNKFVKRAKMKYETKSNVYFICEGFASKILRCWYSK